MTTYEVRIAENKQDLEELNTLLKQATRKTVKDLLTSQVEKTQADIARLEKLERERAAAASRPVGTYTKKIDTFGWDQSDKFVKIYITSLSDYSKIKEEDVKCTFTPKSVDLVITNLNNVNYNFGMNNLLREISPEGSYFKLKSDMIAIFLKKSEPNKSWEVITEKEQKTKDKAMPKFDENADPQDSLMTMMKKMYEEGDDEMKRTITKAFVEGREKSAMGGAGDMGGLGGLGGMGGMGGMGGLGGMGGMDF